MNDNSYHSVCKQKYLKQHCFDIVKLDLTFCLNILTPPLSKSFLTPQKNQGGNNRSKIRKKYCLLSFLISNFKQ